MKIDLPHVKWRWNRDGKTKAYYHRPTGTRLPNDPASPEFAERLRQLNEQMLRPDSRDTVIPGSFRALVADWKSSPKWEGLAAGTKALYTEHLDFIITKWGNHPVKLIDRESVIALRDKIARQKSRRGSDKDKNRKTTRKADACIDVLSSALKFALDKPSVYGLQFNPAFRVETLHKKGIGHPRWPEEVISKVLDSDDTPVAFRRLVMLTLYTGQRIGDVVRMTWADYDGSGIHVTTQKTGRRLRIPCHPALKAMLDEMKRERDRQETPSVAILLAPHNSKPWVKDTAKHAFTDHMRAIGHPGYSAHGLRKSACARLVEADVNERDIAETVGMTVAMVQHYTQEVRQQVSATRAIAKLAAVDKRAK